MKAKEVDVQGEGTTADHPAEELELVLVGLSAILWRLADSWPIDDDDLGAIYAANDVRRALESFGIGVSRGTDGDLNVKLPPEFRWPIAEDGSYCAE